MEFAKPLQGARMMAMIKEGSLHEVNPGERKIDEAVLRVMRSHECDEDTAKLIIAASARIDRKNKVERQGSHRTEILELEDENLK